MSNGAGGCKNPMTAEDVRFGCILWGVLGPILLFVGWYFLG